MAKWVEYFIARRMSGATAANENHPPEGAMMARVATIAVALSLAVMILSLAVILGFQSEVHTRLTALSGDVILASTRGVTTAASYPIVASDLVEEVARTAAAECGVELRRIDRYATRGVIVKTDEGVEGVILKGVDAKLSTALLGESIVEGELPDFGGANSNRNAMVSRELASELGIEIGERLELIATNEDGSLRRDLYRVGAIYSLGGGAAERSTIVTDLRNVQRLNGWHEGQISGYEISLSDRNKGEAVAAQMNLEMLYHEGDGFAQMAAYALQRLYPSIFDWLAALDMNGVVVISIMMVVAIFNIITALLILVLERVQMIGVLKALGMRNSSLRQIFLLRALSITIRGLLWGNGVGIALALVQRHFKLLTLDESGYMLSTVPIELGADWILSLNLGVVVAIVLVVLLPTRIVGSIEPHRAIKFQ